MLRIRPAERVYRGVTIRRESQAEQVFGAAANAREEIAEALRQVHMEGTG